MINIIEKLKDCPNGTKLYSPIFGNGELTKITDRIHVRFKTEHNHKCFDCFGRYSKGGEVMLFPSKENVDWNTFIKVEPKFKVGDKIVRKGTTFPILTITFVNDMVYSVKSSLCLNTEETYDISAKIVENDYEKATFHPNKLKPFNRLLVKRHNTWQIAHFGYFKNGTIFTEMGQPCNIDVVPYNDSTMHLLGTSEEYNGFYKWWN